MAKIMTDKEWIVLAYEEGKKDLAQRLLDEINQIDVHGTDEYENGANWAIGEVIDIIQRLVGDSDGDKRRRWKIYRQRAHREMVSTRVR